MRRKLGGRIGRFHFISHKRIQELALEFFCGN